MKKSRFFKSEGFILLVVLATASGILFYFNPQVESYTGVKLFLVPLTIFLLLSGVFAYVILNDQWKKEEGRVKIITFLKYSLFIPGMLMVGIVLIFGAGKLYSSFDPWPKEKKEAYQFYLLEREITSNPELLSKITVLVQKDNCSFYDTISSPSEFGKLSYPRPHEVLIKIPYGKWDKMFTEDEMNNYLLTPPFVDGIGCSSNYFLFCCSNEATGVHANVVNIFKRYYHDKLKSWTQTPYSMEHQELRENEDPIITLKEARSIINKI